MRRIAIKQFLVIASIAVIGLANPAIALAQGCDLLLRDGVFNSFNQTSGRYAYDKWHQAWCSGTIKQSGSSSSTSVSLDMVVEAIPIGLGFSDAQQFQSFYKQQFCGNVDRTKIDLAQDAAFTKTADPALVAAYVQCRQVENAGLVANFTLSPDQKVFTIAMRYNGPFEMATRPALRSISFVPATAVKCAGTIKPPMKLTADFHALQCERTSDKQVSIMLNTAVGAYTRHLAAVPAPPSDQQIIMAALPSGTILGWAAKTPIPAGWRICDGQAGTPNLVNRVPLGTSAAADVAQLTGADTHSHQASGTATNNITHHGWAPGIQFQRDGPQTFSHTHPVAVTVDAAPHLPPATRIIFIMKM